MRIPFGELRPDQPDLAHDGLEEALNCIPFEVGYGPFPDATVFSSSVSGTAIGAISVKDTSNNNYTFAGTPTKLFRANGTGWDDVSRTATYNTAAEDRWNFTQFGNTLIGVNGTDAQQIFTLGTSTDYRDQSASASAPVAKYIAVVGDFVWVAGIPTRLNEVQWSAFNNPLRWTVSVQTQADFQPLGGQIVQGITGGDFAAVLTQDSIWRADYIGTPGVFSFAEVAPGIGCKIPGSVARFQNLTFFYSGLGFHAFDGVNAVPIGTGKIDDYFAANINNSYLFKCTAIIDPVNRLYIISYPDINSATGTPNRLLMYKWTAQRWARAEEMVELIFLGLSAGYTLEGLDAISGSIDALPFSLDSAAWQGGLTTLSGFNNMHRLVTFDGDAKTARFVTGESQLVTDQRAFISAIRPLVQGDSATSVTALIGGRDRLVDTVVDTASSAMNSLGLCPVRSNSRYQRFRFDISAGFTRAMGLDVNPVPAGRR